MAVKQKSDHVVSRHRLVGTAMVYRELMRRRLRRTVPFRLRAVASTASSSLSGEHDMSVPAGGGGNQRSVHSGGS